MSTLDELLDGKPKIFSHVACGCRVTMTLCNKYEPNAVDIEIGEHVAAKVDRWCTECMDIWSTQGCVNCDCGPDRLCHICTAALEGSAMEHR